MKKSLLASTAMGTLMAASSAAHADGFGLRVFGGLNFAGDESFDGRITTSSGTKGPTAYAYVFDGSVDFDTDLGYVFGGAIAYDLGNGFVVDLEVAYRRNKLDIAGAGLFGVQLTKIATPTKTTFYSYGTTASLMGTDGHVSAVSLMANAWYEFDTGTELTPFIGAGVGIAWVDIHDLVEFRAVSGTYAYTFTNGLHGDDSGFAWQVGAGVAWEFDEDKAMTLEYRYFNGPEVKNIRVHDVEHDLDYDYASHSVMVGFKVGF